MACEVCDPDGFKGCGCGCKSKSMSDEIEKRAQFELGIVPYHTNELTKYSGDEWGEIAAFKKGHKAGAASCAAGPWVSVKERLPPYDQYVLWCSQCGNFTVEALDKDGNPWLSSVTHWAEIREPEEPSDE